MMVGFTTMPPYAWFFAAERTMVGPPISIFSMASSKDTFGLQWFHGMDEIDSHKVGGSIP